jgi:putative ABC transport system substrate-binding protein
MDRRAFFGTVAGGLLAAPLGAKAQEARKVYHVGFLWESPTVFPGAVEAFHGGLRDLGWIEGQNLIVDHRWTEGRFERLAPLAEDLVRLNVDVIVAPTSIYTAAAKQATSTIPIVFMSHADPVRSGHVISLARPGGNITGLSLMLTEMYPKFLELLKEVVPTLSRVAVLWDPATPSHPPGLDAAKSAARTLRLQVQSVPVRIAAEFDGAFSAMSHERAGGVLILSTPLFIAGARRLADLALSHKLPTIFGPRIHAEAGGLLSFGPDRTDLFRRAAGYVDRILKGAKPADLPVQQASKFELVINLKTAKVLGLTIPSSVLARADQVIE